jgi:NAD(P)-dependent dehydrogenase (short-subunit alcohol dehydrogenase family)
MISNRLADKRILITGSARGIGAAIARRCVAEGAAVALVDRSSGVHDIAAELAGVALELDVAAYDAPIAGVAHAVDELGGLNGLVNAAAIHRNGGAREIDDASWEAVVAINLTAPLRWIRAAMPHLLTDGAASIVNVTSVVATHAIPDSVAYATTKAGLLGLTRSVAIDYGRHGVRCNALSPGTINTEFFTDYARRNPEKAGGLVDRNFAGRLGEPDEIAAACAYLLADEAGFTNGAEFVVDGGRLAGT